MAYTTIDDPSAHFQTTTYTGNGSDGLAITNSGNSNLQPDWLWIKKRSGSGQHVFVDSSRGTNKQLFSSLTDVEQTSTEFVASLDTDGFTLNDNTSGTGDTNVTNGGTYVAWQWKAGGTAPTKTYKVVVVDDSGNKYRFRNSGDTATFAQSAVTLDLQEGGTYVFDWSDSTAQGHPIRFSTTSDGTHGGGSEYTTGVVKDDSAYKTTITVSASAPTLYYYCSNHSGMGGQVNTNADHGQTNFDGSILSVSQANTTAGLSIVKYTGNQTNGATVGHGLGTAPQVLWVKERDGSSSWIVKHPSLTDAGYYLLLEAENAQSTTANVWNDTNPSSTVFTLGDNTSVNENNINTLCYVFSEVKGYSKFGRWVGNGSTSDANRPFIYTGFKPAMVIWKARGQTTSWRIMDSARDIDNPANRRLFPDTSDAENTGYSAVIDFLSNGFKIRGTHTTGINSSGDTYIYMAFAEHPFVSSKGVPVTAR